MHPMAGQGLNLGMGDIASLSNLIKESIDSGMDVGGTSLFLDRYNRERMVNGLGVVGGVHSLHEIFGVSGTAPGSMYRMADGTYDAGKGNAGILRSLVGYWDECGKWASFCSSNAGGDCCWCYVHISRRQHK